MWKYTFGVFKVLNEKKNEKAPKAARDTREYEETRTTGVVRVRWASAFWGSLAQMASALKT